MDINRTVSRNPYVEDPAQRAERTGARFKSQGSQPADPAGTATSMGTTAGVAQADLRDPRKAEEMLACRFGDLVDSAGGQLGMPVSGAQRQTILDFLGKDPVLRGKLMNYLEQVAT